MRYGFPRPLVGGLYTGDGGGVGAWVGRTMMKRFTPFLSSRARWCDLRTELIVLPVVVGVSSTLVGVFTTGGVKNLCKGWLVRKERLVQ